MRFVISLLSVSAIAGLFVSLYSSAADKEKVPTPKPVGIEKRIPWTTSNVKGSPEPPLPYRVEVAFPKLQFFEPLEMASVAGSDRLFVAERPGKIFSFPDDPAKADKAELFLDIKKTIYGLALHPKFADNGYIFVTYVTSDDHEPNGTRIARFQRSKDNPLRADPASEKVIFSWPSGGHNGGCIRFGPDGYLYIATGDGSGIADELKTGQNIGDHLASLLRIDVDHSDKGKAYRIPKDNPFNDTKGAKPEIWAYGLRQAWKYSFDRKTGDLWAGEVGQDLWEMVYRIERGGNYGWSVTEGAHPFRPERPRGPTPILPPVIEHPHSLFRSLTGGYVYHGTRLKELKGSYIYGDFDTGRIWAFRYDGKKANDNREIAKVLLRVVAFGEANNGEIYLLDFTGGKIHRLVNAPKVTTTHVFPRKLSRTGLFASTKDHKPAPGLIPYSVNSQLWSDGLTKERFLAIPGDGKIEYESITYPQPAPGAVAGWRFPDGTVAVKTFSLDMERGNPASRRRLETRILHYEQFPGTEEYGEQYWLGYTYLWNEDQTDADLIEAGGIDRTYTIKDPKAEGGVRKQTWHFPSRSECTLCHTQPAKFVLGLNTLQLNRDHEYGNGVVANQMRTLDHLGIFTKPLPKPPEELARLVDPDDEKQDLDKRARSYLQANCAHCHMKWGGGNAEFQLLATLPLKDLGIVNTRPAHGAFDIPDACLIVPGSPDKSLIYYRMSRLGLGHMPHVGSNVVDEKGTKLIADWIKQLPAKVK